MTSREELAGRVRAHVTDRGLEPGDRLPSERALAHLLGVSRPALREATRRLVELGVLETRRGAGTFVKHVDLADLMAVRLRLEPLAAELAARRATVPQHRRMRALMDELRSATGDAARFAELDLSLHALIAAASDNAVLIRCLDDLDQMLRLSRARTARAAAVRAGAVEELGRLVEAVVAGRPDEAADAMALHLQSIAAAGDAL